MTLKEVCEELGMSEATLQHSFPRTVERMKKKGVILMRWREGFNICYNVEYETEEAKNKIEMRKRRKTEIQKPKVERRTDLDKIMEEMRKKHMFEEDWEEE